jgi:methionyl-tRNA formyltransferase
MSPACFLQVSAVVSQPGKPKGRGNKGLPTPSPVEALARQQGMPDEAILCPKSAKEVGRLLR